MLSSILRQLFVLLPAAYVLARIGQHIGDDRLVWASFPVAEVVALAASLLFFRKVYRDLISKVGDGGLSQTA